MRQVLVKLWKAGAEERTSSLVRQILLTNTIALSGAGMTALYQILFLVYGLSPYVAPFAVNLVCLPIYLSVMWLNHAGRHDAARNLIIATACTHIFVFDYLIGRGTGLNLLYFVAASILPLVYYQYRLRALFGLGAVLAALYVTSHFAFAPDTAHLPLPGVVLRVLYANSVVCALGLSLVCAYLFKVKMEQVEAELTASNRTLEKLSISDELTRVANRRGMEMALGRESARVRREGGVLSILMCDVDYFKRYNDYYGHPAGDAVLQRVAGVLAGIARRPSDLVARYGGEEFVVILPDTDEAHAYFVGRRVLSAVAGLDIPHRFSGAAPVITVSVGLASVPSDKPVAAHALLAAADQALYQAKQRGRNRIESKAAAECSGSAEIAQSS